MVYLDMGLPDLPEKEVPVQLTNHAIAADDSDGEERLHHGYQMLPTGPNEIDSVSEEDSDDEPDDEAVQEEPLPPISSVEQDLLKEVWSSPAPKDIVMDSEKVNQVKEALVNFKLPSTSIPDWANKIPEEEWTEQILKRIQKK